MLAFTGTVPWRVQKDKCFACFCFKFIWTDAAQWIPSSAAKLNRKQCILRQFTLNSTLQIRRKADVKPVKKQYHLLHRNRDYCNSGARQEGGRVVSNHVGHGWGWGCVLRTALLLLSYGSHTHTHTWIHTHRYVYIYYKWVYKHTHILYIWIDT